MRTLKNFSFYNCNQVLAKETSLIFIFEVYVLIGILSLYTHTHTHSHTYIHIHTYIWASLVAQMIKNLPTKQETWVRSLSQEDPLEKGMATHSNILAWRIPWTEEPGRLWSMGLQTDTTEAAQHSTQHTFFKLTVVLQQQHNCIL